MKKRYKTRKNNAVSEALGTILLLGIAIAIFSVLYFIVLSESFETEESNPTIYAFIEGKNIVLEHRGGAEFSDGDIFSYTIGDSKKTIVLKDNYEDINSNNLWNFGERMYIPLNEFSLKNKSVDILGVKSDETESSIAFQGSLDISPQNDLGVEIRVDNRNPVPGKDTVNITIIVRNFRGDIAATNVTINFIIPEGLEYLKHTPGQYNYTPDDGTWHIDKIDVRDEVSIVIEADVSGLGKHLMKTQLAMILDGSSSIGKNDWNTMLTGLSQSIKNSEIFPNDGSIELTVVQFGGIDPPRAELEIGPVIVNNTNYITISEQIENITQMVHDSWIRFGYTPMGCGIRLATDILAGIHPDGSDLYDADYRRVINLVTDGEANCYWNEGTYEADYVSNTNWYLASDYANNNQQSLKSTYSILFDVRDGELTCVDLDASEANYIDVDFWYRLDDTEGSDLKLYYYNGGFYEYITELGGGTEDTWLHYTDTITDSDYLVSDFRIRLDSSLEYPKNVWLDDVIIKTDTETLLNDNFEDFTWESNWSLGKYSTEKAREYLISTLEMDPENDEFDVLAVTSGPDIPWLNNSIVWPQPGYEAPPYTNGPGWYNHTLEWADFLDAVSEMFKYQFASIQNFVYLDYMDTKDPNSDNDYFTITITPS